MVSHFLIRIQDGGNGDRDEQKQESLWQVEWTGVGDRMEAGGGEGGDLVTGWRQVVEREGILTRAAGWTEGNRKSRYKVGTGS